MLTPTLLGFAVLALLVLLVIIAYAAWVAHNLTSVERVAVFGHPRQLGLHWEDITFPSKGDRLPLSGWYLPTPGDDRCIILVQGTEHHRNSPEIRALQLGRDLVDRGFSVLLYDFRGRGKSGGNRSSEGDREQWGALGAIDYVESRGIPVERIGLLGFSLGAGVAILVAAQEPRIPAVVSDSGFLDYMVDLRKLSLGPFRYPAWFAYLVALVGRAFFKADFSRVRPVKAVQQVDQPVLFIHGEEDSVIPVEETEELHSVSDNPEDRIWIVPGAEHVKVYHRYPEEYIRRVSSFFHRHIT